MLARKRAGAAGGANGVGAVVVRKDGTIVGNAVDVWCFVDDRAIGADSLVGMVVAHHKDDVWPTVRLLLGLPILRQRGGYDPHGAKSERG